MSRIKEQAAYIRGLAEGLGIDNEVKEHRVLNEIITLLNEMATQIDENKGENELISVRVDTLTEDVSEMQDLLFESFDDLEDIGMESVLDDEDMHEIECPRCGEGFLVETDTLLAEPKLSCPNCGTDVNIREQIHEF